MNKYARFRCTDSEVKGKDRRGRAGMALLTHDEVGKLLGITRQRVQQIERVALHRLKIALKHWQSDLRS